MIDSIESTTKTTAPTSQTQQTGNSVVSYRRYPTTAESTATIKVEQHTANISSPRRSNNVNEFFRRLSMSARSIYRRRNERATSVNVELGAVQKATAASTATTAASTTTTTATTTATNDAKPITWNMAKLTFDDEKHVVIPQRPYMYFLICELLCRGVIFDILDEDMIVTSSDTLDFANKVTRLIRRAVYIKIRDVSKHCNRITSHRTINGKLQFMWKDTLNNHNLFTNSNDLPTGSYLPLDNLRREELTNSIQGSFSSLCNFEIFVNRIRQADTTLLIALNSQTSTHVRGTILRSIAHSRVNSIAPSNKEHVYQNYPIDNSTTATTTNNVHINGENTLVESNYLELS